MSDHVSIDELADAAEGLLSPRRRTAVDAHLAGCADCRAAAEALSRVSDVLAAEPTPAMPPEVERRLGAVINQESRRRATTIPVHPDQRAAAGQQSAPRRHLLVVEGEPSKPTRRRWLVPALAAAAAATIVGFGGYVLSASAGLNEPPVVSSAVNTKELGSDARALEQGRNLNPHRFSKAWQCARQVTEGRIVGLASTVVDGAPALLVYTRSDGVTMVTVVTGCDSTPTAGPSAPVSR